MISHKKTGSSSHDCQNILHFSMLSLTLILIYNSHEVNSPEIIMLAHQTNNQERVQSIKIQNYKKFYI